MPKKSSIVQGNVDAGIPTRRGVRADAQRNMDALLEAARDVFAASGVDAPVREIAERAGVGVGTFYRHFPERSNLIAAVMSREIDACADAAPRLASGMPPGQALAKWIQRYAGLVGTKRGLAPALHSGDPAYDGLRDYFEQRVRPALAALLQAAVQAGDIRSDVDADDVLNAVTSLCMSSRGDRPDYAQRMVAFFIDGLRYLAQTPEAHASSSES